MKSLPFLTLVAAALAFAACGEEPLESDTPPEPPPPSTGIQAFIQVDNDQAGPGEMVRVFVKVQIGTDTDAKLGSYTGGLHFDPAALGFADERKIEDGLRVTNVEGAPSGAIRFAGAAARGFNELTLFEGVFQVKKSGYIDGLALEMEELSAALSFSKLTSQLRVAPTVFVRGVKTR